ncbi:HD domain-containing protein [Bacillaceae bacterium SIJ1]|uniref:HD domain-containing protein n=1 Tax=Litoribacterium kuwaitense TaxID=1398745 RepID=UPI0013EDE31A|nr:HD domain-containing protein [Litoribacterium kuwaitense]NGP45252.1 HD domain-containing protein [Litoribacterium kuwaitense]
MRQVTLEQVFLHPVAQKYLGRSGIAHAITVAENALRRALREGENTDLAVKAALLHDIGHHQWYRDGQWDYQLYRQNDIHAIKGATRAHKLLVQLGEKPSDAKAIAVAILLHTDSYLPEGSFERSPLQRIVHEADEADEEPGGAHHYRRTDMTTALQRIRHLDRLVDRSLTDARQQQTS